MKTQAEMRAHPARVRGRCFVWAALMWPLAALAGQGIEGVSGGSGTLYWDDGGWTGDWNYLCVADNCVAGTKVGTRYQRTVSGVVAGNTYQIQIKVQDNATGQYISPFVAVVAVAVPPTGTPAVPSGLAVGGATSSSLTVSWNPSSGAQHYNVYRSGAIVASPTSASFVEAGLTASTTYTYTVSACDSANNCSAQSAPASGTTGATTPPPPSASGFGIDASGMLYHEDDGWTASFNYLCLNDMCTPGTRANGRFARPVSVVAGTTYTIQFKVQDATIGQCVTGDLPITYATGGASISSPCAAPDTTPPTVPTGLVAAAPGGHSVQLTWNASTDNRAVTRYDIYQNGSTSPVGSSTTTSFAVTGLTQQTTYTFQVRACDAAGNCSAQCPPVSVTTPVFVPNTTPPTVPTGLQSTAATPNSVTLAWNASTAFNGGVVVKYDVYQGATLIVSPTGTTATVSNLTSGGAYTFSVRACDDSNNCSAQSAPINVTTPVVPINVDFTSNSYSNHNVGPPPRPDLPAALLTPINGLAPPSNGFAFDINGSSATWRWGPNNVTDVAGAVRATGDSGLEMYCSTDNNFTFQKTVFTQGTATIPCTGIYTYFFRWLAAQPLNNNPASQWLYTALFTTASRIDPSTYPAFTDGSSNWFRYRHPISYDGITASLIDNTSNAERVRDMDRYPIWVNDSPGNVALNFTIAGNVLRVESQRNNAGAVNGQNFYGVTQNPGFGNIYSYGQVIQFEITAVAGRETAQTYNDFAYYTVGYGWGAYGDPRLKPAGKAATTMWFSDNAPTAVKEHEAIFRQPLGTIHTEDMVNNFIVGHHLFHGIDPNVRGSQLFDNPAVRIGSTTCGACHFRDGRGSQVIQTPRGPRIPPPVYGVGLLQAIDGRQAGFGWGGQDPDIKTRIQHALVEDHGIQLAALPQEAFNRIDDYVEGLTVPNRDPGSYDIPGVPAGEVLFTQVGCASCHIPVQHTSSTAADHLRNLEIRPYTDMKVWNVNGGNFRTAPLWGLGHNIDLLQRSSRALLLLHDGSATTIDGAIQKHDGAAATARANYNALSAADRDNLVKFVGTL